METNREIDITLHSGRDSDTGLSVSIKDDRIDEISRADVYIRGFYVPLTLDELKELKEEINQEIKRLTE